MCVYVWGSRCCERVDSRGMVHIHILIGSRAVKSALLLASSVVLGAVPVKRRIED